MKPSSLRSFYTEKKQMLPVQYVYKIYRYILLPTNLSPPLDSVSTEEEVAIEFQDRWELREEKIL